MSFVRFGRRIARTERDLLFDEDASAMSTCSRQMARPGFGVGHASQLLLGDYAARQQHLPDCRFEPLQRTPLLVAGVDVRSLP